MRVLLLPLVLLFCVPVLAQTTPPAQRDPQAVAVLEATITKMGGATAISPLQSWRFEAQAEGRIDNGTINKVLSLSAPQNPGPPPGAAAKAHPWARPRSLFVPALVSTILVQELQDPSFSLQQGIPDPSIPNSTLVVFSLPTKSGQSVPAQRWYFDTTTNLPTMIEFALPAKIGLIESFPGVVTLSDYRAIGGVLYPFRIGTSLLRENGGGETVTLQIVTPSTAVATGGVK